MISYKDYVIYFPSVIRDLEVKSYITYKRYIFSGINLPDAIDSNFACLRLIFRGYNILSWSVVIINNNHYKIKIEYCPIDLSSKENFKIDKISTAYLNADEIAEQYCGRSKIF